MSTLNKQLTGFYEGLKEINYLDKTALFTASDFGRTFTTNGNGTDHGWGGNHFVIGGPVKSGMYGSYPSLAIADPSTDDGRSRGRWIPTTSTDQYYEELAGWVTGMSRAELIRHGVLRYLGNFDEGMPDFL